MDLLRQGDRDLCPDCRERPRGAIRHIPVEGPREGLMTAPRSLPARLRSAVEAWCTGRSWLLRLPLLLWFGWILVRHWGSPTYQSLFKPLNLGIHELGHYLFAPLGQFVGIAGGSILQCLAPILSMGMFLRQRDFFAIVVCLGWLSTNIFDVATYAGDASAMALPLVSPGGGDVIHDWNYLLGRLGLLGWDGLLAFVLRVAASADMIATIALGAWLLWTMARLKGSREALDDL